MPVEGHEQAVFLRRFAMNEPPFGAGRWPLLRAIRRAVLAVSGFSTGLVFDLPAAGHEQA
jgi:hypothetical protein